jgi:hypothetical protein
LPPPDKVVALAQQLYAKNPEPNTFFSALHEAVGYDWSSRDLAGGVIVGSDALTVVVAFPYEAYNFALTEQIRKREPIAAVKPDIGVRIVVAPKQIDAPDIEKIIVERDGRPMQPMLNQLTRTAMTTRMGAKAMIHAGSVLYACSAFAPGGDVTVTAVPASGDNFSKTFSSEWLAKRK